MPVSVSPAETLAHAALSHQHSPIPRSPLPCCDPSIFLTVANTRFLELFPCQTLLIRSSLGQFPPTLFSTCDTPDTLVVHIRFPPPNNCSLDFPPVLSLSCSYALFTSFEILPPTFHLTFPTCSYPALHCIALIFFWYIEILERWAFTLLQYFWAVGV